MQNKANYKKGVKMNQSKNKKTKLIIGLVLSAISLVVFLLLLPASDAEGALSQNALNTIGIFLTFVLLMVFDVVPMFVSGAICCTLLILTKTLTIGDVLTNGFGSSTVWFIIFAYALTAGVNKTGLLRRLAFKLMTFFPDRWSSQVIALEAAGFIINPLVPSGQAKITIFAPMTEALAKNDGLEQHSKGAVGIFMGVWPQVAMMTTAWATSTAYVLTAAMTGETYSFIGWMAITGVWLAVMTVVWTVYVLIKYKPEKAVYEKGAAKKAYADLGPMSKDEIKGLVVIAVTVLLWIFGTSFGVDNTTASIIGFALACVLGLLDGRDLSTVVPWSLMLSMFFLMPIFSGITKFGVTTWVIKVLGPVVQFASNPVFIVLAICVLSYIWRQVVVDVTGICIICTALFGSLATSAGMPLACVTFSAMCCTAIYNNPAVSMNWIFANGASRGWISWEDVKDTAWPFAILNVVALLVSIPIWLLVG